MCSTENPADQAINEIVMQKLLYAPVEVANWFTVQR